MLIEIIKNNIWSFSEMCVCARARARACVCVYIYMYMSLTVYHFLCSSQFNLILNKSKDPLIYLLL